MPPNDIMLYLSSTVVCVKILEVIFWIKTSKWPKNLSKKTTSFLLELWLKIRSPALFAIGKWTMKSNTGSCMLLGISNAIIFVQYVYIKPHRIIGTILPTIVPDEAQLVLTTRAHCFPTDCKITRRKRADPNAFFH